MALKRINSGWQVYTYDPATKTKKYRGVRPTHREAKQLERDLLGQAPARDGKLTIREYAGLWLDDHHGEGTRRPSPTTRQVNELNLRQFLDDHGDKTLDAITRREALRWAKQNRHRAKTVSAMFNDAVDDEETSANPFANRRHPEQRGRRDIHPLTEVEVATLADIALHRWGPDGYGKIARAWVLWSAWVGTRPGETFRARWADLDIRNKLVTVRRIKPPYNTDTIVVAQPALEAVLDMPRLANVLFPAIRGDEMHHVGGHRYYWEPIRSAFQAKTSRERWLELCEGQENLDLYACRHFCGSIIVERGGNEYDVAAQLGNTPQVARERYIHEYEDRQRERLRGLLERPEPVVDLNERRRKGA